jgi:hypothetical protein
MSTNLKLSVTLRYGTFRGTNGSPSAADRNKFLALCQEIAADMGDEVLFARTDPTPTLSWPVRWLELSYSALNPAAAELRDLAQVWKDKLEAAYGIDVRIDADTR